MRNMQLQAMATDQSKDGVSRSWIDLPRDILSVIVDRLPLIDLLSFRGTCKDFRSATPGVSAQIQSSLPPWILMFNRSECVFYDYHESKTYKRNISDLDGVICLASYQGWLLLFRDGSVFFFCPFSLTKIPLPDFPHHSFDGHVASFSDAPTSPDCIVSVINRVDPKTVEVNVISKGEKSWTRHLVLSNKGSSTAITGATFDRKNRSFHYIDNADTLLTFSVKDKKWKPYQIVKGRSKDINTMLPYYIRKDVFPRDVDHLQGWLGVEEGEGVAVCGFTCQNYSDYVSAVYLNEFIDVFPDNKRRLRRAVWIQPRYYDADRNHHW